MIIEILSGRQNCDISINGQEFEEFRRPEGCNYDSHLHDASANPCPINVNNSGKFKATDDNYTKISDNNLTSIKITGSDVLKDKQLPLPCSLWKNIRRQSKRYLERPTNVSIIVKVNNISVYKCIFKNDQFYECAITSKLSLFEYTSMRCMQEDGTIQNVFEFNNNNKIECKKTSHVVLYMFISYCVFTVIIGVCTCRKSRLSYAIVHKLKSFSKKGYKRQVYTFDAFISYSHSDIAWVLKFYQKMQSLGNNMSFDEKDFIVGSFISDNIYHAFNESRKVIFIVTEHFLQSKWGEFELEVARTYALENGRHNMIIVVLKDDVSFNRMPNALKDIWYKTTCIKWFTSKDKQDDVNNEHENKCFRKVHKAISVDY
ncbi:CD282 [Mytilus edulis]|uniref:TLR2 n=1 Tax=Mytilus edulis TaxID=6550 RepID=A0A8S3SCQ6_MYTED|nr:CD282 [Mytilus edulis]